MTWVVRLCLLSLLGAAACQERALTFSPADLSPPLDFATPVDLTPAPDLAHSPSEHPEFPIVPNQGGPILAAPEVWVVVWDVDRVFGHRMLEFTSWAVDNDEYWVASLGEYGVGRGKGKGLIVLPGAAPATLSENDVETLIAQLVNQALIPSVNANTLVAIFPAESTQTTLFGQEGCQFFGGYHNAATVGATEIPFTISLRCGNESVEYTYSHELAEAATDPRPLTVPAWVNFEEPLGGEVSDLCNGLSRDFVANVAPVGDGGVANLDAGTVTASYTVTRNWSVQSAAAGNLDPCQPTAPGEIYYNVGTSPRTIPVVTNASGRGEADAELWVFAFGKVGPIKWQIQNVGAGVNVTPSSGTNLAGERIPIKVKVSPIAGSIFGSTLPILITSTASNQSNNQIWISAVSLE